LKSSPAIARAMCEVRRSILPACGAMTAIRLAGRRVTVIW